MGRHRVIHPDEATLWLGVLLDSAFDPTSKTINLARSAEVANQAARDQGIADALHLTARDGQSQLLALASDFVSYPEEYSDRRRADLLLNWVERWMQPGDWARLAARVRKRRSQANNVN
jgi:hypothetical protein